MDNEPWRGRQALVARVVDALGGGTVHEHVHAAIVRLSQEPKVDNADRLIEWFLREKSPADLARRLGFTRPTPPPARAGGGIQLSARERAAVACSHCDREGWLLDERGEVFEPARSCNHQQPAAAVAS